MKPTSKTTPGEKTPGNYALSRFNATRHGILSHHTVLPWEDREEYDKLHLDLRQEYAPRGLTEEHLVEEIAGVIWRKRRLRLAESAAFRNQYCAALTYDSVKIVEAGILDARSLLGEQTFNDIHRQNLLRGLLERGGEMLQTRGITSFLTLSDYSDKYDPYWEELFTMTADEAAQRLQEEKDDIRRCEKALDILKTQDFEAYQLALAALLPDTKKFWEDNLADETYHPTPEDLRAFLWEVIADARKRATLLANHGAILDQAQGEAFSGVPLENLSRYEVFLDRKLKNTLGLLLQLQQFRHTQKPTKANLSLPQLP